ncbi:hypothetical protein SRHO_G00058850 [Serrasalmus rhombeus]
MRLQLHLQPSEQVYECLGGPCSDLPQFTHSLSVAQTHSEQDKVSTCSGTRCIRRQGRITHGPALYSPPPACGKERKGIIDK